jgi:hypothetical protein
VSSAFSVPSSVFGSHRYDALVTRTTHAVLESPGATEPTLRWAVFHNRLDDVPPVIKRYVDKVRHHAYKVTDSDVQDLKDSGYSEDAIFEITAAASTGAAIMRLERGLIALHESAS